MKSISLRWIIIVITLVILISATTYFVFVTRSSRSLEQMSYWGNVFAGLGGIFAGLGLIAVAISLFYQRNEFRAAIKELDTMTKHQTLSNLLTGYNLLYRHYDPEMIEAQKEGDSARKVQKNKRDDYKDKIENILLNIESNSSSSAEWFPFMIDKSLQIFKKG